MTGLDDKLRAADPAREVRIPDEVAAEVLIHIRNDPGSRSSGRLRRKWAALGVAGLLVAGGAVGVGPAVAQVGAFLAQTGLFPQPVPSVDPHGTAAQPEPLASAATATTAAARAPPYGEAVPGSEWIDTTAVDFVQYALNSYTPFPLPDGYDERRVMQLHAENEQSIAKYQNNGQKVLLQAVGLQSHWENTVRCLWLDDWKTSNSRNDSKERARAAEMIAQSAEWKATVAGDPGGVMTPFLHKMGAAAINGDTSTIDTAFQIQQCYSVLNGIRK